MSLSAWNTCTRNILSAVRQNTATRQLTSKLKERRRKRGGERERIETKLYSSLSLVVCVYLACHHLLNGSTTALNPSVSEDRGGTSCSDRTRITLEVQHCDHNVRTECEKYPVEAKKRYTGGYGQGRISVANTEYVHVSSGHLAAQLCYFLQRC